MCGHSTKAKANLDVIDFQEKGGFPPLDTSPPVGGMAWVGPTLPPAKVGPGAIPKDVGKQVPRQFGGGVFWVGGRGFRKVGSFWS